MDCPLSFDCNSKTCTLHESVRHAKIPGRGSKNPKVVFVGQAPGREEDIQGKCFVGPAGQLLTQAIRRFRIKDPYITNLCKCFPPDDRDPNAKEIKACLPGLLKEIEDLKPEYVVPLGNIALKALTGLSKITKVAGKEVQGCFDWCKFFPMLHPSYIVRYEQNLPTFERHFARLAKILNGDKIATEKPHKDVNCETAKIWLNETGDGQVVAFDYETTGVKSQHDLGRVRCVGFCNGKKSFWVRADSSGFQDFIKWFLTSDLEKLAHNLTFELRVSVREFGVRPKNLFHDTQALHFLLSESRTHGLKEICETELQAEPWDLGLEGDEWATANIDEIGEYCRLDCHWTWELYRKLRSNLSTKLFWLYQELQIPLQHSAAELEENGIKIDTAWVERVRKELVKEQEKAYDMVVLHPDLKRAVRYLEKKNKDKRVNLNSADQVRELFAPGARGIRLPLTELTEGKKYSVKDDVLEKFREKYPVVNHYMIWKSNQTVINNFLDKFLTFINEDGLLRARIDPCHVVSGRLSVTKPPLQAFPDDPRVRGMVISRWEGGKILAADYSQFEMRLIANMSQEKKLIRAFENDEDVHDLTASIVFGDGFTPEERSKAKRMNFGMVNELSIWGMASQFLISEGEAAKLIRQFRKGYPSLYRYLNHQHQFAVEKGYIESPMGRRRRFGVTHGIPDWQVRAIERQAGSFPIQSTGADFTNLAIIYTRWVLKKKKLKSKVILQIHDSLLLDVYPGEEVKVKKLVRHVMEEVVPGKFDWMKLHLPVDLNIGERWESWKGKK